MKVLRIINSMNPEGGGPCQGIRYAVPEWTKFGHYTLVLSLDAPVNTYTEKDSFEVVAVGPSQTSWGYSPHLKPWLIENLDKFDAVIVHGLWQYHSFCTLRVYQSLKKKKKNLPRVYVMPHGMLDPYFQKAEGRKLKSIRNYFYWKFMEQSVIKNADALLFTCQQELILARTTFQPYQPAKEINVGYGIPEPRPYEPELSRDFKLNYPNIEVHYLLFLSRIHPKKGLDLLIEAFGQLNAEKADLPQLVIAGPGLDSNFGREMQARVSDLQLESKIIFPGMLSGDMKWAAFYGCQAFVLPSHQENFGISIAEAMACGKAVLISNQVNIWREIESSDAGFVFDDSLEGVYQLLAHWLQLPPEEKLKISENAKLCFKKYFEIEVTCQNMIQAFVKLNNR